MKNAHKNTKIQVDMKGSYKLGMNEVIGLRDAMLAAFQPVVDAIKAKAYWNETLAADDAEYKSRDGFIPHSHNCGGLQLGLVIPKCEEYEFGFLEFGECDGCNDDCTKCTASDETGSGECMSNVDGYLDAYLRIWFKFEGIDDDGRMQFYVNACGGNGDAPYFRVEHLSDIFEAQFSCKSVKGLQRAATKHIKALLKALK